MVGLEARRQKGTSVMSRRAEALRYLEGIMRRSQLGVVCLMVLAAQAASDAHFKLLEPASWIVASDRGDPQKAAPCGGDNKDKGTPSNIVNKAIGGQKVHIK